MFTRRLLLRLLASPMFLPVTAAVIAIPVAHAFSHASTRDLAAGAPGHQPLLDDLRRVAGRMRLKRK